MLFASSPIAIYRALISLQDKEVYIIILQWGQVMIRHPREKIVSSAGAVWPGWQSGDRHPGPLIWKVEKNHGPFLRKFEKDRLHKL